MYSLLLIISFSCFLIIGMPIGFCMGLSSLFVVLSKYGLSFLILIPQKIFGGINCFPLVAIPLFILSGEIMAKSGIVDRLLKFSNLLVGHMKGGLALANIVGSMFFAGISGSAAADTAIIGGTLIPAMIKSGYQKDYSAAVTASSSVIGPIIPPSILMVIYGYIMQVSVAGLFAAGIIPGILIGLGLMGVATFYAHKENHPKMRTKFPNIKEFLFVSKDAIIPLISPLIILGGVIGGIFTPTEAASVAVVYSFIVGFFIYRTLKFKDIIPLLGKSLVVSSTVFLIIGMANLLLWVVATLQIPSLIVQCVSSFGMNRYAVLFLCNIAFLLTGMILETTAAALLLSPVLASLAYAVGVHPLHFAIIVCVNLLIGLCTPPMGECLFLACGIASISLEDIVKRIWPFVLVEIVVLLLITFVPDITMTIPRILGYY